MPHKKWKYIQNTVIQIKLLWLYLAFSGLPILLIVDYALYVAVKMIYDKFKRGNGGKHRL